MERKVIERWGILELEYNGKAEGNPFVDYEIIGEFFSQVESKTIKGFYDGDGKYIIRFMPSFEGDYKYKISGSFSDIQYEGSFTVTKPTEGNHGPVHVANKYHFEYADGTPYYSIGTTCYVWNLQSDELINTTLETLRNTAFNKIRFCVLPKHWNYNLREPRSYPYIGTPMDSSVVTAENCLQYGPKSEGNNWDFYRFNTAYFRHIEYCIKELQKLGIEADLIVMHPYDRWGFSCMEPDQDELYWKYVIARFAAFRNVWWSLANEYDLFEYKSVADFERYGSIICETDPYNHPRSVHNCYVFYDHTQPWISHASIQRQDIYKTAEYTNEWREQYGKPIVLDEIAYEGNLQFGWGNIDAEEMVRRFWEAFVRGGYPGHAETYLSEDNNIWWSHGGVLYGESYKRFGFLKEIMYETPGLGLRFYEKTRWDEVAGVPENSLPDGSAKDYYLFYYSFMRPSFRDYYFDDETEYEVSILDTWNMTREKAGIFKGKFRVYLPGKKYIAVQMIKRSI